jgi:hypothetical protein
MGRRTRFDARVGSRQRREVKSLMRGLTLLLPIFSGSRLLRRHKRVEAPGIASTYLVETNKSGNQKGNLSYLAGTKKRSDSLIQSYFQ